jgi:DNA-binding transcriptional ArsR family regulator
MRQRATTSAKRASDTKAAAKALDVTIAALADPQRREVIEILRDRPRPAGELARLVGLSAPAMSRQLRTLRESGLVSETHGGFDARVRVYRLVPAPMENLKVWLEETERLWSRQLVSFKAHLEKTKRRK